MAELLKLALKRIGIGLLYGIGFGVSAGLIIEYISQSQVASLFDDEPALDQVVITEHDEVTRDGRTFILGTLENRGLEPVRRAYIKVDLFDKDGRFVDLCPRFPVGHLRPGETMHFKAPCGGSEDKPVVAHQSYKVYVDGL
ncbi:MAG: FxLYD domain-containing protein [Nitrospirota bacterium]